jgi:hypothetical protein
MGIEPMEMSIWKLKASPGLIGRGREANVAFAA